MSDLDVSLIGEGKSERDKFEEWAASEGFDLVRHSDETYATQECHDAWAGWQASRRAALEEAKQLCIDREARVEPVTKGDCEWFTGFSEGIKTGARHCACEIDDAIRALSGPTET